MKQTVLGNIKSQPEVLKYTLDHFSCCSDRIWTYTDPEADPHVW